MVELLGFIPSYFQHILCGWGTEVKTYALVEFTVYRGDTNRKCHQKVVTAVDEGGQGQGGGWEWDR